jgi:hypothetical protein
VVTIYQQYPTRTTMKINFCVTSHHTIITSALEEIIVEW